MGVSSFWDIVGPTARPVRLESLEDRKMAIDASIWIYQFLKAMRDSEGNSLKNSHIVGFFRRICKLLYFGIRPVFVFDGGVPALKRDTIRARNEIRQGKRDSAQKTARKLLAIQLHKKSKDNIPAASSSSKGSNVKVYKPQDDWNLPDIEGFLYDADDQRINANFEEEKQKQLLRNATMEDILDSIDLDSINPASKEFEELPKAVQYQLLSSLRLKSRLRMGYTKEQLQNVFPNSMDFSKFQIDMVRRRNFYTQKIINVTGIHDGGASKLEDDDVRNRIAGQKDKEYKLTKTENGWTLGLDDLEGSRQDNAIILDADIKEENVYKDMIKGDNCTDENDEDEDFEWEEVDLKPQHKKKDNFDYSLKAGRLPQFEQISNTVGSKSFLDTRPNEESPVKRTQHMSPMKNIIAVSNNEDKDDEFHNEDEDEDEYLRQIEEIQVMEAMQKSKLEQLEGNKKRKLEQENEELKEDTEIKNDSLASQKYLPGPRNVTESLIKENDKKDKTESSKNIYNSSVSEGQQNLNFMLQKLPTMNNSSFLFNSSSKSEQSKLPDKEPQLQDNNATKEPIPETPIWFQTSKPESINNTYEKTKFVDDKDKNEKDNSDKKFELLSGFLNTEEVLREKKIKERSNSDIEDIQFHDTNTDPKRRIDIADNSSEEEEENFEPSSDHTGLIDVPSPNNDMGIKPLVFNYEFSEDEEENLVENIRKEAQDFETFRNNELLSNNSNKVVDTAFMEDELFEQQMKEKRDSDEVTIDMINDVKELLSRFGIPFVTAPMEAEAQCAELLSLKLVDGIITDDSDVFLFGGTKIYKNLFQDKKYVEFYDYQTIVRTLGIERNNMIELAMLLGSDYANGIKGMGPVSGMEVIAEFHDLKSFKKWYEEGQFDLEKQKYEGKFERDLRKKLIKNEVVLDSNFPSEAVRDAYLSPEVDHDTTPFKWGNPDLDMLRGFMKKRLGWPQEKSDEVLVPLIKDINKRRSNKKQMTLGEFFPSEFSVGNKKVKLGKRITNATDKLKKQRLK